MAEGASGFDERAADSVMRAVGLVEERMGEDIGAQDMARAACYSPFYFSRLFAKATGHAPYDYLMRRRVAAAAAEVVGGSRSLTDIALDYGFDVPDSFARAFRRCFGELPSEARRKGSFARAVARTRIERAYVEAALARPFEPPEAVQAEESAIVGERIDGTAAEGEPARLAVVERDDALREAKVIACHEASGESVLPLFPRFASRLPGGPRARFAVEGGRLGLVVEFAYRAWLPRTRPYFLPPYDIVEIGPEGPAALLLPLPE